MNASSPFMCPGPICLVLFLLHSGLLTRSLSFAWTPLAHIYSYLCLASMHLFCVSFWRCQLIVAGRHDGSFDRSLDSVCSRGTFSGTFGKPTPCHTHTHTHFLLILCEFHFMHSDPIHFPVPLYSPSTLATFSPKEKKNTKINNKAKKKNKA